MRFLVAFNSADVKYLIIDTELSEIIAWTLTRDLAFKIKQLLEAEVNIPPPF